MKRMFPYIRPLLSRMIVGMTVKFGGSIMDLFLPWILAYVIDTVTPTGDKAALAFWGILMLICSILAIVGNIVANRMASAVARDITWNIRHDLFSRIIYLSNRQIDQFTIPSLISRMTTDTYNMHRMVTMMQRVGIRAPILLVGGILITLTLDPVLTGVLVCMLPLLTLVVIFRSKQSIPLFRTLQTSVDKLVRVVRENASGIRVIKALSKTDYEMQRFDGVNREVMQRENKANMTMAIVNPVMNFLLNVGLVLVVLVGAYRVNAGVSDVGKIVAFLSYFTIILNALLSVSRVITQFSVAAASANRIAEVLDTPEDLKILPPAEAKTEEADQPSQQEEVPHIVFDHVSFSYAKKEDNLTDINFSLKKGETLGILGPTGSGKSTIVQLLMRFYDIDKGSIRINGRDIREIPLLELRKQFGVVFQNDVLFENDLMENIRLGRDLTEEEILQAAQYAQASQFIQEAGGLHAHVAAKGANFSGGQKQRVLIARALAAHPDILILDDSSSALDYKTDALLRGEIREHFSKTTSIIVAQRISSIKHADHILVLEDGKELGYGNHEELVRTCQVYREISKLQMGDGEDE